MCEGMRKTGVYCGYKGKYLIDGQLYCGFHKKQMITDIVCKSCNCIKQSIIQNKTKVYYCKDCYGTSKINNDLMDIC